MKHKVFFLAVLMMVLAMPLVAQDYDFSAVAPSGQTLYYKIVNGSVQVTGDTTSYHNYESGTTCCYRNPPTGALTIPSNVTYNATTYAVTGIGFRALEGCSGLTSVTIPNSVTSIGFRAFSDCSGLTSVTIPNSVTSIGEQAFSRCTGLTSIHIPNSVTQLGSPVNNETNPFGGCFNLASITVASDNPVYDSRNNCNAIIQNNRLIAGCMNTVIPNGITAICGEAFTECKNLTSITLPNTIFSIDGYAFSGCIRLNSITIPSSVRFINGTCFMSCPALTSIVVDSDNPYLDSRNNCNAIIETNTNKLIVATRESVIPNTVTSIANYAFASSSGYPICVTIPSTITSVGSCAFTYCWGYTTAFKGLVPPTFEYDPYNTAYGCGRIIVPCASLSDYQTALNGYSGNIECVNEDVYAVNVASADYTMGVVYGGGHAVSGGAVNIYVSYAYPGYHFVRWNDNVTDPSRTVTVTGDVTYTAYFEPDEVDCDPITSFPWNNTFDEDLSCWKTVDADGDGYNWLHYQGWALSESYSYFDSTRNGLSPDNWLISRRLEIPANGNYKLSWSAQGMDNNYYSEHYSVYVSTTGDNPSDFTTQLYSETLNTPNTVNRSVSLQNYRGQTVRIAFRHHNTTDKFILGIGNVKITQNTQSIDEIEENGVTVYAYDGRIVVEGAEGMEVRVFDMMGRMVAQSSGTYAPGTYSSTTAERRSPSSILEEELKVPASGIYLVKVGTMPARKVVVVR